MRIGPSCLKLLFLALLSLWPVSAMERIQGWCEIGAAPVTVPITGGIVPPYGPFTFTGTSSGAILPAIHNQGTNPFVVVLDSAGNNVSGTIAINISAGVVTIGGSGTVSDTYTYTIYGGEGNPTGPPVNRRFMQSFPKCTVKVYYTGTTNVAAIFSTSTDTPMTNPFTADQFGRWFFYAPNGNYDVQISGGGLPVPYTFGAISAFDFIDTGALNPSFFGCKGDGTTDDSVCWISMISSAISTGKSIWCPGLTYKVSKQGTTTFPWDGLSHPYVFLVGSPVQIAGECAFSQDMTDAGTANVFVFKSTSKVRVSGLTFNGSGTQSTQMLYDGSAISFVNCTDCYADHISSWNMRGNTLSFNSTDVGCDYCFSSGSTSGKQGAHWGFYACSDARLTNSSGYGGTTDGDVSFFGNPAFSNKAIGNSLYNYAWNDPTKTIVTNTNQGFTIDSGQTGTLIQGNYAYGYYYCIDNKTQSTGTIISGNTVEKCKVGIDTRLGENPIINQTTVIANNSIRPLGGNGNGTVIGPASVLGVFVQDSFGVDVHDNVLEASYIIGSGISGTYSQPFVPIYAVISSMTPYGTFTDPEASPFLDGLNVHDNLFAMEQQQGSIYTYSDQAVVVVSGNSVNNYVRVKIHDNQVKFRTDAAITSAPFQISYATGVDISGNRFGFQVGQSGLYTITCSYCTRLGVNNNHLDQFGGFLSASNSSYIAVSGNVLNTQTRDLSSNPMPLISGAATSNWIISGNQRIQNPTNTDNGRFFQATSTTNVVLTSNIMDQEIFEDDWYQIGGVSDANTSDVLVTPNLRLGPTRGPTRMPEYTTSPSIGGSPVSSGSCTGANVTSLLGVYPGMHADVYPSGTAVNGPGQGFSWYGIVTAHNTVAVSVCNNGPITATPSAMTYIVIMRQ